MELLKGMGLLLNATIERVFNGLFFVKYKKKTKNEIPRAIEEK